MRGRLLATLLGAALITGSPVRGAGPDYAALFAKGISFTEFLAGARQRREAWQAHYAVAADDASLARVRALA